MISSIYTRHSTRFFLHDEVLEEDLTAIIDAGRLAPSPKNRQPWIFVAVRGKAKEGMLSAMREGIARTEEGKGILPPDNKIYIANAKATMAIMREAPLTIFVVNPLGRNLRDAWSAEDKINELSNIQAIGAAMENMALAAEDRGIGSLWNGNVFFAFDELTSWLGEKGVLAGAMSFGYGARKTYSPRKKGIEEILRYK